MVLLVGKLNIEPMLVFQNSIQIYLEASSAVEFGENILPNEDLYVTQMKTKEKPMCLAGWLLKVECLQYYHDSA